MGTDIDMRTHSLVAIKDQKVHRFIIKSAILLVTITTAYQKERGQVAIDKH